VGDIGPDESESLGGDDRRGKLTAVYLALKSMLIRRSHGNNPARTRHFQLEVRVVRDGHELRVTWPPQDGVVGALETHHLEGEGFLSEIGRIPECYGQVDLPERYRLLPWHEAMKRSLRGSKAHSVDPHGVEGVDVEDVQATASVHQNPHEALGADDRVDDQWASPWLGDAVRVVATVERDHGVRPPEIRGHHGLGHKHLPPCDLLLMLGLAS